MLSESTGTSVSVAVLYFLSSPDVKTVFITLKMEENMHIGSCKNSVVYEIQLVCSLFYLNACVSSGVEAATV